MDQIYQNQHEHLFDELRRLDLLLLLEIEHIRKQATSTESPEFRGLFLSETEINAMLVNSPEAETRSSSPSNRTVEYLQDAIRELEQQINVRIKAAEMAGLVFPLYHLKEHFRLAPFDMDTLLICLAPELDLKYEKIYAYLNNDITRKKPTVDLILRLTCNTVREKINGRKRLEYEAPLVRNRLISIIENCDGETSSFLSSRLSMDRRIVNYILEIDLPDSRIEQYCRFSRMKINMENLLLSNEKRTQLQYLFRFFIKSKNVTMDSPSPILILHGAPGVGKKFATAALCESIHKKILIAETAQMIASDTPPEELLLLVFREAFLKDSAIYFDYMNAPSGEQSNHRDFRPLLLRLNQRFSVPVFVGCEKSWYAHSRQEAACFINFHLPTPGFNYRRQFWENLLTQNGQSLLDKSEIDSLANKFQFTPGKIHQAMETALHFSRQDQQNSSVLTKEQLYRACRNQSTPNLGALAQKMSPIFGWQDIVLPADTLNHLREISLHLKHRQKVFNKWNFNQKISLGRGTSALFVGQPGTGKTMAAEIIAHDLELDMYKIDLSSIVSKYIGETEKNLSKIFQEAEYSNAILFFDEADALFGKRSEVKDSHDRYANIEVNYLLQKMEEYDGMVILASNFRKNMDEAFTRRLRFIVDFPFPKESYRHRIWQQIFPKETPINNDVRLNFLARKFEISGGHIKNIALSAAFMAAENSGLVSMKHLIRATKREFQKMGRFCVKTDFEEYYDLLQTED